MLGWHSCSQPMLEELQRCGLDPTIGNSISKPSDRAGLRNAGAGRHLAQAQLMPFYCN